MSDTPRTSALEAEVDRLKLQVHSLKVDEGSSLVHVGEYLLSRLAQLGVKVSLETL